MVLVFQIVFSIYSEDLVEANGEHSIPRSLHVDEEEGVWLVIHCLLVQLNELLVWMDGRELLQEAVQILSVAQLEHHNPVGIDAGRGRQQLPLQTAADALNEKVPTTSVEL